MVVGGGRGSDYVIARWNMNRRPVIATIMTLLVCPVGRAQIPATQPALTTRPTATAPAGGYRFRAAELTGRARTAPVGTDPNLDDGWSPITVGDLFGPGVQFD